jgi:ATP-binding cassette, subfamily B, multidrug efflux pump
MRSLRYLNKFFIRYKWRLLLGFVFVTVSNVLLVSQGLVIRNATDEFAANRFANKNIFLLYAGELLALTLLSGFFMFLKRQFIIVVSRYIEYDLKNEIYRHYQVLDLNFYKRNRTGDLMNRISEDVSRVRMYVGPAIMYIVDTVITITTVVSFMWHESVHLTLLVLAPLPILSVIVFKVSSTIGKRSGKVQEALSGITSVAQETFSGIRVAKAYNKEEHFIKSFISQAETYRLKNLALARIDGSFQPFIVFMVGLSLLAIVFFGGKMYAAGEISSVGNFPQFVFYVFKLTWPFASFGWVLSLMQRAAASQERINQFLETQPEIVANSVQRVDLNGEIRFNNVTYTYPDTGITALKNVSFTVKPGRTLGIVGRSGSGKTTVAQMLMRFMDVQSGEILVNGHDLKDINLRQFRDQTGYVQQDVFLFSDTVRSNIAFSGDFSQAQVEEAAKLSVVYDNIMNLSEKFDTVVGERGVTLSGGQKQRIAIARAIIKKPRFFVFDDCLSAVDADTEHQILNNLKDITAEKTGIIISHRVSSLQHADEIIVLDHGQVIERGSHAQLLARKGEYFSLYQKQNLQTKKG